MFITWSFIIGEFSNSLSIDICWPSLSEIFLQLAQLLSPTHMVFKFVHDGQIWIYSLWLKAFHIVLCGYDVVVWQVLVLGLSSQLSDDSESVSYICYWFIMSNKLILDGRIIFCVFVCLWWMIWLGVIINQL